MKHLAVALATIGLALSAALPSQAGPLTRLILGAGSVAAVPLIAQKAMLCKQDPACAQRTRQRYAAGKAAVRSMRDAYGQNAPRQGYFR